MEMKYDISICEGIKFRDVERSFSAYKLIFRNNKIYNLW